MNLIDVWWKRLLICLIFAGILSETVSLITYRKVEVSAFIVGILLYFVLGNIHKRSRKIDISDKQF